MNLEDRNYQMDQEKITTAGIILIGNELLSGDTVDVNIPYIAKTLVALGIQLKEASIIPDCEDDIIRVMRNYSHRFTYVFSTGGIGPTHDDITAGAVSKAFNRPLVVFPEILQMFQEKYGDPTPELLQARQRMATVPEGSILIPNTVATAPGFQVENVFIMAGVPIIMRSMMNSVVQHLEKGKIPFIRHVTCQITEGKVASGLAQIQMQHPETEIGSYPHWGNEHPDSLKITIKGYDSHSVDTATNSVYQLCQTFDRNLKIIKA
jgi:molybdenum cofactor synthesis domain-containing protein